MWVKRTFHLPRMACPEREATSSGSEVVSIDPTICEGPTPPAPQPTPKCSSLCHRMRTATRPPPSSTTASRPPPPAPAPAAPAAPAECDAPASLGANDVCVCMGSPSKFEEGSRGEGLALPLQGFPYLPALRSDSPHPTHWAACNPFDESSGVPYFF